MIKKFDGYNPFTDDPIKGYDTPDLSYVGPCDMFFDKKDLQNKQDIIDMKDRLIEFLSKKEENKKLTDFKRKTLINKLNLMYLYLDYYEYFEKRYGKKTYRYTGKDSDIDKFVLEESMIIKASKMNNLSDNYGFDGGFVDFWSFGDGIVFKTIKRLKII